MIISNISELREHINVIGDNDFKNVKGSLRRAEKFIKKYIGNEIYKLAELHYLSDNYHFVIPAPLPNPLPEDYPTEEQLIKWKLLDELVYSIQDPLVSFAYYLYSPQANVLLTDSGYQVAWTEHQRPALEWQIDRAVRSILDMANEFMDNLLEFLDENGEDIVFLVDETEKTWLDTNEYKVSKELFINSAKEFSKYFNIKDSRRLFIDLHSIISKVEREHIVPVLTKIRAERIRKEILDVSKGEETKELMPLIGDAIAYLTMSRAIKDITVEWLPEGLFETYINDSISKKPARIELIGEISNTLRLEGQTAIEKLQIAINTIDNPVSSQTCTSNYQPRNCDSRRKTFRI